MTAEEFGELQDLELNELYANLGVAGAGAMPSITKSFKDMKEFRLEGPGDWLAKLIQKGKEYFQQLWPQVKGRVCQLYSEGDEQAKEWIEKAATAILAVFSISAAIAILVVKIAIKMGLDMLCEADAG